MVKTTQNTQPSSHVTINGQALSIAEVNAVARQHVPVAVSSHSIQRIRAARAVIDTIAAEGHKVYGVTTGFGHLSSVRIPQEQLVDLQHNLLRSHAAGVGEPLSEEVTRTMMLLLAASLARGHSGVRVEVVQLIIDILNAGIYPQIPSRGSVGASGDLAPLAHLALILVGEGEAIYRDQRCSGAEALQHAGLTALRLEAKEGLALINGTHLMEAIAVLAIADAQTLVQTAEVACAMTIEGLMGSHAPLDARIHQLRGQHGQQVSATRLRKLVRESEIRESHANCAPRHDDGWFRRLLRRVKLAMAGDDEELLVANQTTVSWRVYHNYHLLGIIDAKEQHIFRLSKHGSLNARPATGEEGVEYLVLPLNVRVHRIHIYRRRLGKEVEVYDMRVA